MNSNIRKNLQYTFLFCAVIAANNGYAAKKNASMKEQNALAMTTVGGDEENPEIPVQGCESLEKKHDYEKKIKFFESEFKKNKNRLKDLQVKLKDLQVEYNDFLRNREGAFWTWSQQKDELNAQLKKEKSRGIFLENGSVIKEIENQLGELSEKRRKELKHYESLDITYKTQKEKVEKKVKEKEDQLRCLQESYASFLKAHNDFLPVEEVKKKDEREFDADPKKSSIVFKSEEDEDFISKSKENKMKKKGEKGVRCFCCIL